MKKMLLTALMVMLLCTSCDLLGLTGNKLVGTWEYEPLTGYVVSLDLKADYTFSLETRVEGVRSSSEMGTWSSDDTHLILVSPDRGTTRIVYSITSDRKALTISYEGVTVVLLRQ